MAKGRTNQDLGRKVSVEDVRSRYGEGGVMVAGPAKVAGLVDRIATLEEVVSELARGRRPGGPGAPGARAFDPGLLAAHAAAAGVSLEDGKGA